MSSDKSSGYTLQENKSSKGISDAERLVERREQKEGYEKDSLRDSIELVCS